MNDKVSATENVLCLAETILYRRDGDGLSFLHI